MFPRYRFLASQAPHLYTTASEGNNAHLQQGFSILLKEETDDNSPCVPGSGSNVGERETTSRPTNLQHQQQESSTKSGNLQQESIKEESSTNGILSVLADVRHLYEEN